jgi:hypothetical protein
MGKARPVKTANNDLLSSDLARFGRVAGRADRPLAARADEGHDLDDNRMRREFRSDILDALEESALVGEQEPIGPPQVVDIGA